MPWPLAEPAALASGVRLWRADSARRGGHGIEDIKPQRHRHRCLLDPGLGRRDLGAGHDPGRGYTDSGAGHDPGQGCTDSGAGPDPDQDCMDWTRHSSEDAAQSMRFELMYDQP
jgi:hypothetical protein